MIAGHWKQDDTTLTRCLRDKFAGSAWWFCNVEFVRGSDPQYGAPGDQRASPQPALREAAPLGVAL